MTHGENIRRLRNRLGLTQALLSKKLKVTQVTVSAWETNIRQPSPKFVCKLLSMAKAKGIETNYEDLREE